MNNLSTSSLYYNGKFYDRIIEFDSIFFKYNLNFWLQIAKIYSPSSILELGCGTGRITIPLAEEGFDVLGLDISDSMLNQAKEKYSKTKLLKGKAEFLKSDIRYFNLEKKYSMVIMAEDIFTDLFSLRDVEYCLSCIKQSLRPEGLLIIDTLNPSSEYLSNLFLCKQKVVSAIFEHPENSGTVVVTKSAECDLSDQTVTINLFFKLPNLAKEIVETIKLRIYFPQELEMLLNYNGFFVEKKLGNYDFTDYNSNSMQQILICRVK